MNRISHVTASILAGGLSRRMGTNKAFIKLDGSTIIERTARLLGEQFEEVNIIANEVLLYEGMGLRVYSDLIKGAGSLGGVYTALFHSKTDHVFVAACDMPLLNASVIRKLISFIDKSDAVVPFINGKFHPMHAVYSKTCLKAVSSMIEEGNLRINDLLDRIKVKRLVEADFTGLPIANSVENINTQEELARLLNTAK